MTTLSQLPASLTLNTVAGNPASLTFSITLTDATGNPIPWAAVSGWTVIVNDQYGNAIAGTTPSVTSPTSNTVVVSWTPAQTIIIGEYQQARWAFSVNISGVGPYTLVSGPVVMTPETYPG